LGNPEESEKATRLEEDAEAADLPRSAKEGRVPIRDVYMGAPHLPGLVHEASAEGAAVHGNLREAVRDDVEGDPREGGRLLEDGEGFHERTESRPFRTCFR